MAEEHLTDGWEPDVDVHDTLLRQAVHVIADCTTSTVAGLGGAVEQEDGLILSDTGRPATFLNNAYLTRPLMSEAYPPLMERLERFFLGAGKSGMALFFSPWPTPDLRPFGWSLMGHPPVHIRPAGGVAPPLPAGVTIEPVTDMAAAQIWERCGVEAYPLEEMLPWRPGSLVSEAMLADPRHRLFLAWLDGEPVGASSAFVEHGVVYVSLVAVRSEARGRGLGSALTWHATLAEPSLPAMLLSSDDGRPVYQRMGYLPLTRFTLWYRTRE